MTEFRDVVRRLKLDHAVRDIQRSTGVHRTIIRELRELSEKNGWLTVESALPTEAQIQRARRGGAEEQRYFHQLERYYEEFSSWVKSNYSYVVMHALIRDRVKCSETTVRLFVQQRFPHKPKAFIRRHTIPGEVMEVDFGYLGITYDPEVGKNRKANVFSGRLRHSRRAWREIVFDQKQQTFFRCHIHAFENFGGVCIRVVPDNLKAAVVKASFEDPIVNRAYRGLAEHYGFLIDPCAPYQARQKGGVESDIKYIKGNFWPLYRERQRTRGHEVPWADELQEALDLWSREVADVRIVKGVGRSPQEIFETDECEKLMELPASRWDPVSWAQPKVGPDWRIQFEKGYYSVPYCYIGAQLLVYGNSSTVRIYNDLDEIALHNRVERPWQARVKDEHAPPHLKEYLSANRNGLLKWAYRLAEPVGQLAEAILADKAVDGLRPVRALIHLADTFGTERLACACRRALLYDTPYYRSVKEILKKQLDRLPLSQPADLNGQLQFRFQRDYGYFDPQAHLN
jgi:transposase